MAALVRSVPRRVGLLETGLGGPDLSDRSTPRNGPIPRYV